MIKLFPVASNNLSLVHASRFRLDFLNIYGSAESHKGLLHEDRKTENLFDNGPPLVMAPIVKACNR
jgi:hypothetical protein